MIMIVLHELTGVPVPYARGQPSADPIVRPVSAAVGLAGWCRRGSVPRRPDEAQCKQKKTATDRLRGQPGRCPHRERSVVLATHAPARAASLSLVRNDTQGVLHGMLELVGVEQCTAVNKKIFRMVEEIRF